MQNILFYSFYSQSHFKRAHRELSKSEKRATLKMLSYENVQRSEKPWPVSFGSPLRFKWRRHNISWTFSVHCWRCKIWLHTQFIKILWKIGSCMRPPKTGSSQDINDESWLNDMVVCMVYPVWLLHVLYSQLLIVVIWQLIIAINMVC